jgi:hypothetical protein
MSEIARVPAQPTPPPNRSDLIIRARTDATLSATGPDTAERSFDRLVQQWLGQWVAEAQATLAAATAAALDRIRDAGAASTRARAHLDVALDELAAARAHHDHLADIVDGRVAGDDGGMWPARSRSSSRAQVVVDVAIYGGAAVVEVGLNYLAFQIMGSSDWETAVLAAAIVLVNVLLPKKIGTMLVDHRRATTGRGRLLAAIVGATTLWVAVSLFVALVRTAFLTLPVDPGTPALVVGAGLSPDLLTWGWLGVVLAVGAIVMAHAAARHNPYVKALREASERFARAQSAVVTTTGSAQQALLDEQRAACAPRALRKEYENECRRLTALAADVVALHHGELARLRASASVVELRRSLGTDS